MNSRKLIVSFEGLAVGYGDIPVMHDLALQIHQGQRVAILGPNGRGKSTLLKTLAGQHPVRSGVMSVLGLPSPGFTFSDLVAKGLRFVRDGRDIFPELTVTENLRIAAFGQQRGLVRGIELIEAVQPSLLNELKCSAWQLSGGQRSCLAFCCALLGNPRLLLADELSEGLDPLTTSRLLHVLKDFGDTTIVFVEQNRLIAEDLATDFISLPQV
jgi:branched-chain amino acid transport system ATP-binding protein